MSQYKKATFPRWFNVVATRTISSETLIFEARVEIQVYADDESHAMRKVRGEFRHYFLEVQ